MAATQAKLRSSSKTTAMPIKQCNKRMSRKSNESEISDVASRLKGIEPGAHLASTRKDGLFEHHGIYVGSNCVIHLQGPWKNSSDPPLCKICSYQPPKKGRVVESCIKCFLRGQSLIILENKIRIPWENLNEDVWNRLRPGKAIHAYKSNKIYLRLYKEGVLYGHMRIPEKESSKYEIDHGVYYYKCSSAKSPNQIVEKARELLYDGFEKYNIVFRNCEHFATYCTTNDSKCIQVENAFNKIGLFGIGERLYKFLTCLYQHYQKTEKKQKLLKRLGKHSSNKQAPCDTHLDDTSDVDDVTSVVEDNLPLLINMVKYKDIDVVNQLGGVKALASILQTNEKDGITGSKTNLLHRANVFGYNKFEKLPAKSFVSFVLEAFKDVTIIILWVCIILSLGLDIKLHVAQQWWLDGGIFAAFIVLIASTISDYKRSRQFQKLSSEDGDIKVIVVRDGREHHVPIFDVVVGDIVCMVIGDWIPADGLFLDGCSLKVDESSMTRERKHVDIDEKNPFLLSGTKVVNGSGRMLVTCVGINTALGEMISSISRDLNEETPWQGRLYMLTACIGRESLVSAAWVHVGMLIEYFSGYIEDVKGNQEFNGSKTKATDVINDVVELFVTAVMTMVVVILVSHNRKKVHVMNSCSDLSQ